jgi:hypothetical protein
VGVYASAEVDDRLVDVPEEAGDELVHPLLAHRLREPRRIGEIEEHDDQPSASRTMIRPQQNARQQFTADQPPGFVHRSDDQGNRKSERDDPKQIDRQPSSRKPMELIRLRVEQKLERHADYDQRGGHDDRPDDDFARQRQPPEHRAETRSGARGEPHLHRPYGQADAAAMKSAANINRPVRRIDIEQGAISHADQKSSDQRRRQKTPAPRGVPHEDRAADGRLFAVRASRRAPS